MFTNHVWIGGFVDSSKRSSWLVCLLGGNFWSLKTLSNIHVICSTLKAFWRRRKHASMMQWNFRKTMKVIRVSAHCIASMNQVENMRRFKLRHLLILKFMTRRLVSGWPRDFSTWNFCREMETTDKYWFRFKQSHIFHNISESVTGSRCLSLSNNLRSRKTQTRFTRPPTSGRRFNNSETSMVWYSTNSNYWELLVDCVILVYQSSLIIVTWRVSK